MHTSPEGDRPAPADRDPHVTGPHAGYDRYGRFDHYYYRCERCGLESTDPALVRGCPRCGDAPGGPDA
ncbi:hypothetical protein ACFQE8_16725 [Salinirubellus sp. GCM10025818]|jgi:hypothetical protein|uniref:hypothetical protein n=1 Tax=Salinirubellus TaxID=2162630 RepID=UPI0030CBB603